MGGLGGLGGMGGAPAQQQALPPDVGEVCEIRHLAHLKGIIQDYPAVIVDFWSPSCPPCMRIKPEFAALAKANDNENLVFCTVNT